MTANRPKGRMLVEGKPRPARTSDVFAVRVSVPVSTGAVRVVLLADGEVALRAAFGAVLDAAIRHGASVEVEGSRR